MKQTHAFKDWQRYILILCLSLFGLGIYAEETTEVTVDSIVYIPSTDGTCSVKGPDSTWTRENNSKTTLQIPASITSGTTTYKVTSIGEGAFRKYAHIKEVTIGENVTSIGENAFRECGAIKKLNLSDNITTIADSAFYFCTGIDTLNLPSKLTSIGECAFAMCWNIATLSAIPAGVTSIGNQAFFGCVKITSFSVATGSTTYSASSEGLLLSNEGKTLVSVPGGSKIIVVPEGITTIAPYAFCTACYNLRQIVLPSTLTEIGAAAFYDCSSLTSVTLLSTSVPTITASSAGTQDDLFSGTADSTSCYFYASSNAYGKDTYWKKMSKLNVIEVTSAGYATFYFDAPFKMPENLTGGIVVGVTEADNADVDWCYAANSIVPAKTPIIIKGSEGSHHFDVASENTTATTGTTKNYLRGSNIDCETTCDEGEDVLYYMLSYDNEGKNILGFYYGTEDGAKFTNGAHKAYLALPKNLTATGNASSARGFALVDEGATTDIESATIDAAANHTNAQSIYTLAGRKINATTTNGLPAGFYIVGGKKVIIR